MRNSCREAQLALTRTILGCSAWRRGVRARRAGSHGIRSWWYVWLVVGMVVRVCAQRAGLSLVGQVREKRSWFRASIVSDFFWGIINFVGLLYVRWFGWRCCWHVLTRPWLWLAQLQQFVWRTCGAALVFACVPSTSRLDMLRLASSAPECYPASERRVFQLWTGQWRRRRWRPRLLPPWPVGSAAEQCAGGWRLSYVWSLPGVVPAALSHTVCAGDVGPPPGAGG